MSSPEPGTRPPRKLVFAPAAVRGPIEQEVQPAASWQAMAATAAITAVAFTWPLAFVTFVVTTVAAPSLTDGAGVGRVAVWAVLISLLIAVTAAVRAPRPRTAKTETPDVDTPPRAGWLRIAGNLLATTVSAGLVLALQGLSVWQVAVLTVLVVVVLHGLPVGVARLLVRRRGRRAEASEQAP